MVYPSRGRFRGGANALSVELFDHLYLSRENRLCGGFSHRFPVIGRKSYLYSPKRKTRYVSSSMTQYCGGRLGLKNVNLRPL